MIIIKRVGERFVAIKLPNENDQGTDMDNEVGYISFRYIGKQLISADSTFVCEEARGQGIALKLVHALCDFARENDLKIKPVCSYVASVVRIGSEFEDLI